MMMYGGGAFAALGRIKASGWRDAGILAMIRFHSQEGEALT